MDWRGYVLLGIAAGMTIAAPLLAGRLREYQLSRAGLDKLTEMTDDDMILHMARLFSALGYRVYRPTWADAGFELILIDGLGQKRGVCVRSWRQQVDEEVVGAVIQAAEELDSSAPMIVTVERYTWKAREAANQSGVILWTLRELSVAIGQVKQRSVDYPELPAIRSVAAASEMPVGPRTQPVLGEATRAPNAAGAPRRRPARHRKGEEWIGEDGIPKCPRCGKRMVVRNNEAYWGCSTFPRCLGTRPRT